MFSDEELELLGDALHVYKDYCSSEFTQAERRLWDRVSEKIDGALNG